MDFVDDRGGDEGRPIFSSAEYRKYVKNEHAFDLCKRQVEMRNQVLIDV